MTHWRHIFLSWSSIYSHAWLVIFSWIALQVLSVIIAMDNCPICNRRILSHAVQIVCQICNSKYHMKCISLDPDDHNYLKMHISTWYCKLCVSQIFPFNHVEDYELVISDINHLDISLKTLDSTSECIFNPFELNTDKYYSPPCDIDPDINFYNEIDYHLVPQYNNYMDNHFTRVIN